MLMAGMRTNINLYHSFNVLGEKRAFAVILSLSEASLHFRNLVDQRVGQLGGMILPTHFSESNTPMNCRSS